MYRFGGYIGSVGFIHRAVIENCFVFVQFDLFLVNSDSGSGVLPPRTHPFPSLMRKVSVSNRADLKETDRRSRDKKDFWAAALCG